MNKTLQTIYDQLEQQRAEVLALVKNLPDEKFHHSSSPKKWSVAQILTHILVAEQLSFSYMKKKALGIDDLPNAGLKQSFLFQILKISQRIPALKFKAPKIVLLNTPPPLNFSELVQRWDTDRAELKSFLERITDQNINKLIYKHPAVGKLSGPQGLMFFREHIVHHLPQIRIRIRQISG